MKCVHPNVSSGASPLVISNVYSSGHWKQKSQDPAKLSVSPSLSHKSSSVSIMSKQQLRRWLSAYLVEEFCNEPQP